MCSGTYQVQIGDQVNWIELATAVAAGKFLSDVLLAVVVMFRANRARARYQAELEAQGEGFGNFQEQLAQAAELAKQRMVQSGEPTTG
jgi:hypothetical protein